MADKRILKVKYSGEVYDVPVCWARERVEQIMEAWGGVVDLDLALGAPRAGTSQHARQWLLARVRELASKQGEEPSE